MPRKARASSRKIKYLKGRKRTKKHKGGAKKHIVYYTCFYGPSGSASDKIPSKPSETDNCYYFTNNPDAAKNAKDAGWTVIEQPSVNIKMTDRDNAMDSKEVKACPHHFKELQGYTYSCYFDSKLNVKEKDIKQMLKGLEGDVIMLLNRHPVVKNSVREELNLAMFQPRYAEDRDKYINLIESKVKNGNYSDKTDTHYETGFILRKSGGLVDRIGEDWYEDIKKTGPACQISFPFIYQKYKDNIKPLPDYYGGNN